jgi:hypothetical protein
LRASDVDIWAFENAEQVDEVVREIQLKAAVYGNNKVETIKLAPRMDLFRPIF